MLPTLKNLGQILKSRGVFVFAIREGGLAKMAEKDK